MYAQNFKSFDFHAMQSDLRRALRLLEPRHLPLQRASQDFRDKSICAICLMRRQWKASDIYVKQALLRLTRHEGLKSLRMSTQSVLTIVRI
jgi:hypothetical protein